MMLSSYKLVAGEDDCYEEKDAVLHWCSKYIKKVHPPHTHPRPHPRMQCCATVKKSDMECVCRVLTEQEKQGIDVARVEVLKTECQTPPPSVGS
ncbi:hypothetical protein BRADI_4g43686v3 [Brachypodium distachyon]|uniref:Bifunctional inhibitor/plant lipid transfer protein/seed storage helical domain-containing protein n=1 Tax=Brachypodium distachyon TaxID=15368 RepID=A0A2K2CU08_BRADI|nr:hypothetical protein BRADI_4g43686v3 [Brachypodium distachyon]